jgi:hypothetical protein
MTSEPKATETQTRDGYSAQYPSLVESPTCDRIKREVWGDEYPVTRVRSPPRLRWRRLGPARPPHPQRPSEQRERESTDCQQFPWAGDPSALRQNRWSLWSLARSRGSTCAQRGEQARRPGIGRVQDSPNRGDLAASLHDCIVIEDPIDASPLEFRVADLDLGYGGVAGDLGLRDRRLGASRDPKLQLSLDRRFADTPDRRWAEAPWAVHDDRRVVGQQRQLGTHIAAILRL